MMLHERGRKSERNRAILINIYETMCDEFRVPSLKRLTRADMARMSNEALYRASKDMYSQATVKQANRLAVKMGLAEPQESWIKRILSKVVHYAKAN
jgi:hypothetical protein